MRVTSNLLSALAVGIGTTTILICAWPSLAQAFRHVTWSSTLQLNNLADVSSRMREPVPGASQPLPLTNGKVSTEINNCDDYLKAITTGFFPGNNYDAKRSAAFVHQCFVLRDLPNAHPATSGNSYSWTDNSLAQLPPMLVVGAREITDAAEQAEKRGESWLQYDPNLRVTKINADSFQAEDDDLTYYLEILARGDFNGDGIEDIAVYGSAQGKHSSWSHSEYLILSPTNRAKLARLTSDRIPYEIKPRIPE